MSAFLIRRTAAMLALLLVVSVVIFGLLRAPAKDYASVAVSEAISMGNLSAEAAEELRVRIRSEYGLDRPVWEQYLVWMSGVVRGDFGQSLKHNKPVSELIGERLPRTLAIALFAHFCATFIGVGLGIYAATHQNRIGDQAATVLSFLGMTIPRFFLALIIVYFLVFVWGAGYVGGFNSPEYVFEPWSIARLWDTLSHIWPVLVISIFGGLAYNLRVMRGNLIDVLRLQYIETARAKGLSERTVVMKHAVPNALHPLIAYQGVAFPYMLAGEIEVAIVLAVPTIGPLLVESLINQDIYVTATILLMLSAVLLVGNLLADITLAFVDPRVRLS
jgi:peptide/nickel transport system permease protein